MAVFQSIGQAFKDGWNKSDRNGGSNIDIDESSAAFYIGSKISPPNSIGHKFNISSPKYYNKYYADELKNYDSLPDILNAKTTIPYQEIQEQQNNCIRYENPFKLPIKVINDATKNYKFVYNYMANMFGDYGITGKDENGKDIEEGEVISLPVVPSMFNPLYGLNIVGITKNSPLFMAKNNVKFGVDSTYAIETHANYSRDLSDCSIKTLVEESNKGRLGRGIYKYTDFMYCKNLGKVSNNRLITLRRFPIPIGDDIWNTKDSDGPYISGDIGRLVTWLDDTNKLEDILKYNYSDSFIKKEAKFQDKESRADDPQGGILGAAVNLANPGYRNMFGDKGGSATGGNNMILNAVFGRSWTAGRNETDGENRSVMFDRYDENRVYEPRGTVRETHLYEGKLSFSQEFSLTFDYELRAYENINPRTAFLDLLNNIQQVTYRKGTFWGGAVWWKGAPENINGWKNANALIDKTWDNLTGTLKMLATGDLNIGDFFGSLFSGAKNLIGKAANALGNVISGNAGEAIVDVCEKMHVGDMLKGMIKNKLGRPALYATNSILTGEPVGVWHVTIGNPRNPIMVMGNLIIDNASIQHYGPLGLDDFPTGLKVTVNLKHAKPRDMMEIGKMYTMGTVGLGVPLARNEWEKFIANEYARDKEGNIATYERKDVLVDTGKTDKNGNIIESKKNIYVNYLSSPHDLAADNNFTPYDTHQISTMWASTLPSKNLGTKKPDVNLEKNVGK